MAHAIKTFKMKFSNPFANIKWKKILGLLALLVLIGAGSVMYFNYGAVYSDGYRAGTLIKFSRKGFVFKTYEGEINQGGIANPSPGTAMMNQIWQFSVKDKEVADKLNKLEGQVVRLHYRQYNKMLPWEGDTNYLVDGVEEVTD